MKQLQIFILATFALFLAACGNDDDGLAGADAGSGKLTATVGGQSWKSKDTSNGAVYAESQGSHIIQAYHDDGSYISLTVFGAVTAGSAYDAANGLFQAQYKPDFEKTEAFSTVGTLGNGTITFNTFNEKTVKGTFEFTGVKIDGAGVQTNTEVKNGSFEFNL